ncbi:MAG: hypothetical protein WA064_02955 [Candidatus Moraniibacteriota bacterium]
MEFNQETNDENDQTVSEEENAETENGTKQWFQDNLRVLVSIFIVIIIAIGIYSYSNRSQVDTTADQTEQNDLLKDVTSEDSSAKDTTTADDSSATKTPVAEKQQTSSVTTSQETDGAFVETAGTGDSATKLARKALADYLEKNADTSLTPEHKIYIEDYLRKNVAHTGGVHIGTSIEFSKSLIGDAISKSKNLSAGQLNNLHKYALRVPSLT